MLAQVSHRYRKLIVVLSLLAMLFGLNSSTWAYDDNTDQFYGNQLLKPLVKEGSVVAALPGGVELRIEDDESKYSLADHLGSSPLTVKTDNTTSEPTNYTPFGDSNSMAEINVAGGHYTSQVFEPETATYDYHARSYDPSLGRFLSVDAIRESISPYSYTENNPINHIDPNGLGRLYYWLYSFGDSLDDVAKARNVELVEAQMKLSLKPEDSFMAVNLDSLTGISFPPGHVENITITLAEGSKFKGGGALTSLLSYYFEKTTIDSIFLPNCALGCKNEEAQSSAKKFALLAKEMFPSLKYVTASPYDIQTRLNPAKPKDINLELPVIKDGFMTKIDLLVPTSEFYSGNLDGKFYLKPTSFLARNVRHNLIGSREGRTKVLPEIHLLLEAYFKEPIFSQLIRPPIPPRARPPRQMAAGGTTPSSATRWYVDDNVQVRPEQGRRDRVRRGASIWTYEDMLRARDLNMDYIFNLDI